MKLLTSLVTLALSLLTALSVAAQVPADSLSVTISEITETVASTDSLPDADTAAVSLLTVSEVPNLKPMKRPHDDLFQLPYSMWTRRENWVRLAENTAVLFGAGFATLGILELLPENATAWNKDDVSGKSMFKRWWEHFHAGPVWDSDQPVFNYILHPYAGAAYYMSARSQGFNVLGSFIYGAFISTVFWELGIECFNEVPSIQDLIITPVGGMILGEAFYLLKRHIVAHDYRLAGSPVLGNAVVFLIDPVNEVLGLIFGNSARQWIKYNRGMQLSSSWQPAMPGGGFGLSITATF
ncbi:MAG: DUF3943 domain-containing protein [Bacteroides sp.]|nr:DUF3943 domain-containing protein [Bacteroides sp.]